MWTSCVCMVDCFTAEWGRGLGYFQRGTPLLPTRHTIISNEPRLYSQRGTLLLPTGHALIANVARLYCQQATLLLPTRHALITITYWLSPLEKAQMSAIALS